MAAHPWAGHHSVQHGSWVSGTGGGGAGGGGGERRRLAYAPGKREAPAASASGNFHGEPAAIAHCGASASGKPLAQASSRMVTWADILRGLSIVTSRSRGLLGDQLTRVGTYCSYSNLRALTTVDIYTKFSTSIQL